MGIPLKCLRSTSAGLSESCLQHFVRFSTSFPQTQTEIDVHMLLNFLHHHEMRHTLQVDIHLEASTERIRGDTGFRLCKYTCTELPPVLPCCHFAAYYSFPEKRSVPELNDQPSYISTITILLYFSVPPEWSDLLVAVVCVCV
jgi:hypothetical protein